MTFSPCRGNSLILSGGSKVFLSWELSQHFDQIFSGVPALAITQKLEKRWNCCLDDIDCKVSHWSDSDSPWNPRHLLLPMGPLYSYSSGVKLTKSWFQCISQTLLVRQPSSTPRAGFGNPVRGVSWLPLVGFENDSPHTNIIIGIISMIILFKKPFMMSRTRWKQRSSLEGGDGRLGGEGTEGWGCRQQVGCSVSFVIREAIICQ